MLAIIVGVATAGSVMAFSQDMSREAIAERIKPAAQVRIAGAEQAAGQQAQASGVRSGEQVYNQACVACHTTGVLGAPRLGNAEDWAPRLAQGMDVVLEHSINGLNAMPPRGTCTKCSDEEILAAIEYMIEGV
ncbi:c-type cytochrome [Aliidiomarina quisquiliarum]|uniref:c-type cytochrome n=1 Tax=Aliidiomarina quisquiliarum TaxID=2938947 RepID=UPI00208FB8C8|nr:c-type cytochrome [Aliidiomarina quisquiliarum]MCO4322272.1 c-type cytochrome [Aliidiomarina quisquiliarum]